MNGGTRIVMEHQPLLTCMDACVDMGYVLGKNSCIDTRDTGISLVRLYNIISKQS